MRRIIIGIHGLSNKPPEGLLKMWWKNAIREGLRAIGHPRIFFRFELVYWANFFYPASLNPKETDKKNELYMEDPYSPAKEVRKGEARHIREKVLNYVDKQLNRLFLNDDMTINFLSISDFIIHHFFSDLENYYSKTCIDSDNQSKPAKEVIRNQMAKVLKKYRRRKILLIAHSMGTIISYDVLSHCVPKVKIDTFITIGSPLGIPIVISKIIHEQREFSGKNISTAKVPVNIKRNWYNFSDLRDKVAIYYSLSDKFEKNVNNIETIDKIVYNNFEDNPHKSYGYLRAPEVAEVIHEFLTHRKTRFSLWVSGKINRFFAKIIGVDYEP